MCYADTKFHFDFFFHIETIILNIYYIGITIFYLRGRFSFFSYHTVKVFFFDGKLRVYNNTIFFFFFYITVREQ